MGLVRLRPAVRLMICLWLSCAGSRTFGADSSVNISGVETDDLRLYYYNYLSFLEPHAVRTFTNSLNWQRRIFDWTPSERTIVQLPGLCRLRQCLRGQCTA